MLLKTTAMLQSLGKGLDKEFDFFEQLQPHVDRRLKTRYSASAILRRLPSAAAALPILGQVYRSE
jgi:predicted unusual protein kinase regulating ubiquinone biosynthesis (AarF/ABC1/UbiB family)